MATAKLYVIRTRFPFGVGRYQHWWKGTWNRINGSEDWARSPDDEGVAVFSTKANAREYWRKVTGLPFISLRHIEELHLSKKLAEDQDVNRANREAERGLPR